MRVEAVVPYRITEDGEFREVVPKRYRTGFFYTSKFLSYEVHEFKGENVLRPDFTTDYTDFHGFGKQSKTNSRTFA